MNNIVGVRIEQEDRELLRKICRARRESVSDFIRRSIRKELARLSYLDKDDAKALEVDVSNDK